MWQELNFEGDGNASKPAAGAVLPCPALLGHCSMVGSSASTLSWELTYISHARVRGQSSFRDKGPFSISVSAVNQENGLGSIHMVCLRSSWTGFALIIGFLYKHQVDDSLSQQSRITLGTLLRCTSTFLAYINFYIFISYLIFLFSTSFSGNTCNFSHFHYIFFFIL